MRSHGRASIPPVPVHRDEVLVPQQACRRWWRVKRGLIHKGLGGREFGLCNAISLSRSLLAVCEGTCVLESSPIGKTVGDGFDVGMLCCSTGSSAVDVAGARARKAALLDVIVAGQFWESGMLRPKPA